MASSVTEAVHVVKITLVKCGLHKPPSIRNTLKALGLNKLHKSVYHKNIRPVRGMIYEVSKPRFEFLFQNAATVKSGSLKN